MNKITAIVLAAGSGSRMKSKTKKQFMEIKGKPLAKEHTKLRLDYRIRGDISDALIEAYCKAEMPPAAKVKDVAQYVEDYWHGIRLENYETETLDNNSEFEKDKVEYVYAIGGENCIKDLVPWIELEFYCTVMRLTCDSLEEVTKAAQIDAQRIDLAGRTLLPGFIDSHSHIINFSQLLSTVALQGVQTPEALQQKLRDYIAKAQLPEGSWIIGFGYDHNLWPEKKQPDRHLLDQISDKYPLMLAHQSGHMGVVNTLALEQLGITMADKDPAGGRIGRENGELTGYFEENAFSALSQKIPHPSLAQQKQWMKQAEETYLRFGVTTAQEGKMEPEQLELMHQLTKEEKLLLDIVGYLDMQQAEQMSITGQPFWQQYINGFKIGGYKIFLDGSPQGRTA